MEENNYLTRWQKLIKPKKLNYEKRITSPTQCGKSFTLQVLQQRAREVAESQLWDQTVAGFHQKVLGLKINFTRKFWCLKPTSPECFEAWNQLHQKVLGLEINFTRKFLGSKLTSPESCQAWNPLYQKVLETWNPLHQKVLGLETNLTRKFRGLTSIWSQFRSLWTGASLVGIWRPSFSRRQTGKFIDWFFLNFFLYCHFHFQIVHWLIFLENKVFYIITFWLSGSWMNDTFEWWSQLKSSLLCRWALVMNCNCVILWYLVISCDILIFHLKLLCIAGKW